MVSKDLLLDLACRDITELQINAMLGWRRLRIIDPAGLS